MYNGEKLDDIFAKQIDFPDFIAVLFHGSYNKSIHFLPGSLDGIVTDHLYVTEGQIIEFNGIPIQARAFVDKVNVVVERSLIINFYNICTKTRKLNINGLQLVVPNDKSAYSARFSATILYEPEKKISKRTLRRLEFEKKIDVSNYVELPSDLSSMEVPIFDVHEYQ